MKTKRTEEYKRAKENIRKKIRFLKFVSKLKKIKVCAYSKN